MGTTVVLMPWSIFQLETLTPAHLPHNGLTYDLVMGILNLLGRTAYQHPTTLIYALRYDPIVGSVRQVSLLILPLYGVEDRYDNCLWKTKLDIIEG